MGGLVFIAALGVGVVVMVWYFVNEARGAGGTLGLFALRDGEGPADLKEDAAEAARYRVRPRLTPERRAGLHAPAAQKAYRLKEAPRPSWRAENDPESDKDD
jgi:hypothetical protein